MEITIILFAWAITEFLIDMKKSDPIERNQNPECPKHLAWLARKEERRKQREIEEYRQTIRDYEDSVLG